MFLNVKALKAVLLTAGRNDVRWYVNAVSIRKGERGVVYQSTDGHRLTLVVDTDPCKSLKNYLEGLDTAIVLSSNELEAALKAQGRTLSRDLVELRHHGDLADGRSSYFVGSTLLDEIDNKIPHINISQRFPSLIENGDDGEFDIAYLADVARAAGEIGGSTVRLTGTGKQKLKNFAVRSVEGHPGLFTYKKFGLELYVRIVPICSPRVVLDGEVGELVK